MNTATSHPKTENRLLLSLMLPILAEQILRSFMGTANTFMLSRISDEASAAVGVSNQILNVVIITATMIGSGASTLINQYLGAKKKREAAHIIMNSLMVSTLVGLFFSLAISALAAQILGLVGLEEGLMNDAAIYLRIVGASCVIQFISSAISAYFRCYQKPVVAMLVIVCTNLMNLAGSWAVVSGMFAGQMMQGVGGIARVRLVSELIGLALSMMMLMRQDWDLQDRGYGAPEKGVCDADPAVGIHVRSRRDLLLYGTACYHRFHHQFSFPGAVRQGICADSEQLYLSCRTVCGPGVADHDRTHDRSRGKRPGLWIREKKLALCAFLQHLFQPSFLRLLPPDHRNFHGFRRDSLHRADAVFY